MSRRGRASLVVAALVLAMAGCGGMARSIDIPRPPAPGTRVPTPTTLTGYLIRPDGPGPFGAVVLLHGCSGLGLETAAKGPWNRKLEWAEWYRARGYAALILDSFQPRRLTNEVCGDERVGPLERAFDAYAALQHLVAQPFVDRDRVIVHGLSQGGSAVLRALDEVLFGGEPAKFSGGIALYPACSAMRPALYAPALILTGELDDWTPAAPCAHLAERSRGERHPIEVTIYPGAYHAFDFRGPRYINAWGKVIEHDPRATADAERRVDGFIRRLRAR